MTSPTHKKFKIIIADDHTLFRHGLKLILSESPDLDVIADVPNGKELVELTESMNPDLVIMDINMPVLNGIEASKIILKKDPDQKILVVSMYSDEQYYNAVIETGVKGFILKDAENAEFRDAVRAVLHGKTYFSQELLLKLIRNKNAVPDVRLTGREQEILVLICQGLGTPEISTKLFLSERTIENHRASLLAKTGCKNSLSLVIFAFKNNLVNPQ